MIPSLTTAGLLSPCGWEMATAVSLYAPAYSLFLTARQIRAGNGRPQRRRQPRRHYECGEAATAGGNVAAGQRRWHVRYVNQFFTGGDAAVAVGDFTGDGFPDLVGAGTDVASPSRPRRWHVRRYPISYSANGSMHTGVAIADFNGDGKLDVGRRPTRTPAPSACCSAMANGTLTYAGAYAVGSSPSAIAVGDFNGDGRPDVAAANAGSNTRLGAAQRRHLDTASRPLRRPFPSATRRSRKGTPVRRT